MTVFSAHVASAATAASRRCAHVPVIVGDFPAKRQAALSAA